MQIAVLFGTQSVEHSISILSARNVVTALTQAGYKTRSIYITSEGAWWLLRDSKSLFEASLETSNLSTFADALLLQPGSDQPFVFAHDTSKTYKPDCLFPVLHGALAEDGTYHGLFVLLGLPYVGCDVLASAVCMNKHMTKMLLRGMGLPTLDWIYLSEANRHEWSYQRIQQQLNANCFFVKGVNLGSSIGVTKVRTEAQYQAGLEEAFRYDIGAIVEVALEKPREIECALLYDGTFRMAELGEIMTTHEFYSYDAKYNDPDGARLVVPPKDLDSNLRASLKQLAEKTFNILLCDGLGRVDFLIEAAGVIYINEVNPMPGFTDISLYPVASEHSGLTFPVVLKCLIDRAMSRFKIQTAKLLKKKDEVTQ